MRVTMGYLLQWHSCSGMLQDLGCKYILVPQFIIVLIAQPIDFKHLDLCFCIPTKKSIAAFDCYSVFFIFVLGFRFIQFEPLIDH